MRQQRVEYRVKGDATLYTEVVNAPGRTQAKKYIESRYFPTKVVYFSWLGEAGGNNDEFFEKNRRDVEANFERQRNHREPRVDNAPVFNAGGDPGVSAVQQAASAGGLFGFVLFFFLLGLAVLTFPVIVGWYSARLVGTVKQATVGQTHFILTLIITLGTFAGATYGGHVLQREYMPEVADSQVEFVETVQEMAEDKLDELLNNN